MATKIIRKDLPGFTGEAWLVQDEQSGEHYVVSGTHAPFSGWEVLVFPSDAEGNVTDWCEVAGGRGTTHEDAINDLEYELSAHSR